MYGPHLILRHISFLLTPIIMVYFIRRPDFSGFSIRMRKVELKNSYIYLFFISHMQLGLRLWFSIRIGIYVFAHAQIGAMSNWTSR